MVGEYTRPLPKLVARWISRKTSLISRCETTSTVVYQNHPISKWLSHSSLTRKPIRTKYKGRKMQAEVPRSKDVTSMLISTCSSNCRKEWRCVMAIWTLRHSTQQCFHSLCPLHRQQLDIRLMTSSSLWPQEWANFKKLSLRMVAKQPHSLTMLWFYRRWANLTWMIQIRFAYSMKS